MIKFRRFVYLKDILNEASDFSQFDDFGTVQNLLGMGYGFASDPSVSIYSSDYSPYTDTYSRTGYQVSTLMNIYNNYNKNKYDTYSIDLFLDDIEEYTDFKILKMFVNQSNFLDIYISFNFKGEEMWGDIKNFNNPLNKPYLNTELYYMTPLDEQYKLKLSNYVYKTLISWFIPGIGCYKALKDVEVKNCYGGIFHINKNQTVEVIGHNINNEKYVLVLKYKDIKYFITENDFYWFKWRFEKN